MIKLTGQPTPEQASELTEAFHRAALEPATREKAQTLEKVQAAQTARLKTLATRLENLAARLKNLKPQIRHRPKSAPAMAVLKDIFPPDGRPSREDVPDSELERAYNQECDRRGIHKNDRVKKTQLLRCTNRKKT
jgi:hypothetical protein